MRRLLALSLGFLLLPTAGARGGLPGPRFPCFLWGSTVGLSDPGQPCQYRFRADGGLDDLRVDVTLRDSFDVPVDACETSATLVSTTGLFCSCGPATLVGVTASDGTVSVVFSRLGGHGDLTVKVTARCCGEEVASIPIVFSTPDLDASCDALPDFSTTVTDLALWAFSLPPGPYARKSDYDCSGQIDIPDLAIWAGGLTQGCAP